MNFDSTGQKQKTNNQTDVPEVVDDDTVIDLVNVREADKVKELEVAEEKDSDESLPELNQVNNAEEETDDYLLKPSILVKQEEVGAQDKEDLIRKERQDEETEFQSQINYAVAEESGEENEELIPPTVFTDPNQNQENQSPTDNIAMVKDEKIKRIEEEIQKMETAKDDVMPDKNKSGNLAKTLLVLGPIFLIACLVISFFIISQKLPNQLEILEISK